MDDFLYDVAFSFLAGDEALATELNELVKRTSKTFLYSEHQKELAGTDGETSFNRVFAEQARCVVVLYRPEWGSTRWTRIEETAIRNRAHEVGYDFALFVPLQTPPSVPPWLPKNRLWIGLDRWGIDGAAAVIEARAQELGSALHVETIEERAARAARDATFEADRARALAYERGVQGFKTLKENLLSAIDGIVARVNASSQPTITLSTSAGYYGAHVVTGLPDGMSIEGGPKYLNTIGEGYLALRIWNGAPPLPGFMYFSEPKVRKERRFDCDFNREHQYVWRERGQNGKMYSSEQLAEETVGWYLDNRR